MSYPKIYLKPGKDRSLFNFHPWVFSGAVASPVKEIPEGTVVEVYSSDKRFLATGHFHLGTIMVRVLSFEQITIDENFWIDKFHAALEVRKKCGIFKSSRTDAYRLIHGEGDYLPGLIIDIYGKTAVIQAHTKGMFQQTEMVASALQKVKELELTTIYDKSVENKGGDAEPKGFLLGSEPSGIVKENDHLFHVNWVEGQKTGFFLDQRENRQLLAHYSKGKNILNTFCYSGGFSIYALKSGASWVDSVDSSKKAIEWTDQNVELNFPGISNHQSHAEDVFDFMKKSEKEYQVIVLDPPAFAKHLSAVNQAVIGYKNLNYEAFKRIAQGGVIFTFSCSQAIDKLLFRKIVFTAAQKAGRQVRVLHQLSQGPDHPVSLYHPEGEYLKGLVLYVE